MKTDISIYLDDGDRKVFISRTKDQPRNPFKVGDRFIIFVEYVHGMEYDQELIKENAEIMTYDGNTVEVSNIDTFLIVNPHGHSKLDCEIIVKKV